MKHARQDVANHHIGNKNEKKRQTDVSEQFTESLRATPAFTGRYDREAQRDDRKILQKKNAECGAAVAALQLGTVDQYPHHDSRATDRNGGSDRHGLGEAQSQQGRRGAGQGCCENQLSGSPQPRHRSKLPQAGELKLQADGKKQQSDSDLGNSLDLRDSLNESEAGGPQQHSRYQVADNRVLAKSLR